MANEGLLSQYMSLLQAGMDPDQVREMIEEQKAMKFANMSQDAQRSYALNRGYGQGIQNLMTGLGMKPAEDPVLRQASMLRQLQQQYDTKTPEGMMEFATALQKQGMADMAQQAAVKAQEMAFRRQQILKEEALTGKAVAETEGERRKTIASEEAAKSRAKALRRKFPDMSEEEAAGYAEDPKVVQEMLRVPKEEARKTEVITANGRVLLVDKTSGEVIKDLGAAGRTLGQELGTALGVIGGITAKKGAEGMGSKAGQLTGEQVAQIQGKEDALTALTEAKSALKSGIYAGKYGPLQEVLAGYAGIGSKQRLANTEYYRTVIGEVVIPRLQEFGGNDSVEELRYLQSVAAGQTQLEPQAIERTLASAEKKIRRGIKRIQDQQRAIEEGKPLPTEVNVAPAEKTVDWNTLSSRKGK